MFIPQTFINWKHHYTRYQLRIEHKTSSLIGSPVVAAILPELDQDELSKATAIIVGNRPRITKRLEEEKRESLEVSLHP